MMAIILSILNLGISIYLYKLIGKRVKLERNGDHVILKDRKGNKIYETKL